MGRRSVCGEWVGDGSTPGGSRGAPPPEAGAASTEVEELSSMMLGELKVLLANRMSPADLRALESCYEALGPAGIAAVKRAAYREAVSAVVRRARQRGTADPRELAAVRWLRAALLQAGDPDDDALTRDPAAWWAVPLGSGVPPGLVLTGDRGTGVGVSPMLSHGGRTFLAGVLAGAALAGAIAWALG